MTHRAVVATAFAVWLASPGTPWAQPAQQPNSTWTVRCTPQCFAMSESRTPAKEGTKPASLGTITLGQRTGSPKPIIAVAFAGGDRLYDKDTKVEAALYDENSNLGFRTGNPDSLLLNFDLCLPTACLFSAELPDGYLDLVRSKKLLVVIADSKIGQVPVMAELSGFSASYDEATKRNASVSAPPSPPSPRRGGPDAMIVPGAPAHFRDWTVECNQPMNCYIVQDVKMDAGRAELRRDSPVSVLLGLVGTDGNYRVAPTFDPVPSLYQDASVAILTDSMDTISPALAGCTSQACSFRSPLTKAQIDKLAEAKGLTIRVTGERMGEMSIVVSTDGLTDAVNAYRSRTLQGMVAR